jgi:uncharacterized protein
MGESIAIDDAAGLAISDHLYAMLHTPSSFRRFTTKPLVDAKKSNEVRLAIPFDSHEDVGRIFAAARANGGAAFRATEDLGFMYARSFTDRDGHVWEPFFMDLSALPSARPFGRRPAYAPAAETRRNSSSPR